MKTILPARLFSNFIFLSLFITISLLPFKSIYAQDDNKDFKFKLGVNYKASSEGKSYDLLMWVSDKPYTGMEAQAGGNSAFIIFNMQDKKMVTVMEAQKMVMIMDMGKYQQEATQHMNDSGNAQQKVQVVKTGVKEKILGYNCDQYKITTENSEILTWVTTELGTGFTTFAKGLMMALSSGKGKPQGSNAPDMKGMTDGITLKMEITDLSTKKVTKLEATAINKEGKEINISDYKIMSM